MVTEAVGEGTDTVNASVSYTLQALSEVEKLTGTGSTVLTLTGNEFDNTIIANGAGDTLNGGAGNDTLQGGGGNDTLNGGDGNDTLFGKVVSTPWPVASAMTPISSAIPTTW